MISSKITSCPTITFCISPFNCDNLPNKPLTELSVTSKALVLILVLEKKKIRAKKLLKKIE
jgi:hypothetical protein